MASLASSGCRFARDHIPHVGLKCVAVDGGILAPHRAARGDEGNGPLCGNAPLHERVNGGRGRGQRLRGRLFGEEPAGENRNNVER